jgi:hypothetical protein
MPAPPLPAIPVLMEVRPFQVSNLCFEVGGILGESFVELGTAVTAFDFRFLYATFRDGNKNFETDHPGRLNFDSTAIDNLTQKFADPIRPDALAALRAEPLRAALDKAINVRANECSTEYSPAA